MSVIGAVTNGKAQLFYYLKSSSATESEKS